MSESIEKLELTEGEARYFETKGEADIPGTRQALEAERAPPEPEAPEEAATEPAAVAPKPEPKAEAPKAEQHVPLAALHEERQRRREMAQQLERERQERAAFEARVDERLKILTTPPAAPPEAIPEFGTDPKGHIEGRLAAQEREIVRLREVERQVQQFRQQQEQSTQQAQALQALRQWGDAQEREFATTTPDYVDAANFLRESRTKELRSLGLNEAQIAGQIQQDIIGVAAMAYRDQAHFAERVYAASQARGYTPKAKPGTEPPPDVEKIATIERGQQLASGLGGAGSAPPAEMTAKRLADMSSAEFDAWCSKHPAQAQRLMGG